MKFRPFVAVAALAAVAGTIALAQPSKDKPAAQPEWQLPPGWTPEDMQACAEAAIPGPMHELLTKGAGVWRGKTRMWMGADTEPIASECTTTVTSIMDGRYVHVETSGEMPGMGMFNGMGIYGFDNVSQEFQASWIDNCGTGIAHATGSLASDGSGVMTWTYAYNCPINKKPTSMREVHRPTGKDSKVLEMFGIDPHTGKEFRMMEITLSRASAGAR
jgi:hypothetical protein